MRSDLSDITIVVDRSGSMFSCKQEAENGVNHFIDEQKEHDGECVLSLVQFDNEYEFVHRGEPIHSVPRFTLVPRGMTALLDAVGRAINETGERLSSIPDEQRPGLVAFVILTDGLENASHEFKLDQIKSMIDMQSSQYQWQFTFLGANQDAFAAAGNMGIAAAAAANYLAAAPDAAFDAASANVGRMRTATRGGQHVNCSYSAAERKAMSEAK